MQNNNFAANLAAVEKHSCGIKPSKRLYFCWTEEQLEQLAALWDTASRTCGRANRPQIRYPVIYGGDGIRPSGEPFVLECKGHWVTSRSRSACIFPPSMPTCCRPTFTLVCMPA